MDERNKNEEIRREKLKRLIEDQGGHAKFVEKHDLTQSQASYLSQIVNGYSFGEKSAEKWRKLLKLPAGFFDISALTLREPDQREALTIEQKQMLAFLGTVDKEARDVLLSMGRILAKHTQPAQTGAAEEIETESYKGPDRRRPHFGIPYNTRRHPAPQAQSPKKEESEDDGR